jgi:hypothetical protein
MIYGCCLELWHYRTENHGGRLRAKGLRGHKYFRTILCHLVMWYERWQLHPECNHLLKFSTLMICVAQKTLKASPLNSRGCKAPPEWSNGCNIDPNGVAHVGRWGTPSECFPLLPLPPVGRYDLRLLSGDAFSVKQLQTSIRVGNLVLLLSVGP